MKHCKPFLVPLVLFGVTLGAHAADWQWSVLDGQARDYLWIPPHCQRLRGVLVANHNMIEQGILEHPIMRKALTKLGFAEVWAVPEIEHVFDFNKGAGEHFERVMGALADISGYGELRYVPVAPMGHSASATYPWNFAAWNPARTLAVLSIHGDSPQTKLTGYGGPNADWGQRNIDGVPALLIMGEYEWWEDRLTPAFTYKANHPDSPIALLADAGHGHYDFSDSMISFLTLFLRKAAEQRLPKEVPLEGSAELKPIDPKRGWLVDRWHLDKVPSAPSAPYDLYKGPRSEAFWCFDREMADATEAMYAAARGKKPQELGLIEDGRLYAGEPVTPPFKPLADGISFELHPQFLERVSGNGSNPARWTYLPNGSPLGHASGGGPIVTSKSVGPVVQTGRYRFAVHPDRTIYTPNRRNNDIWLLITHPGDAEYKSMIQQIMVRIQPNKKGEPQSITFPAIVDATSARRRLKLAASSSAGLPVSYFVLEGPAEVEGGTLRLMPIPPRAKFPVKVTVVAWQFGLSGVRQVQTADWVERTFWVTK